MAGGGALGPDEGQVPDDGTPRSDEDVAADVFDFREAFLLDRDRGARRPLVDYLARFPGSEDAIAEEYVALTREGGEVDGEGPPEEPGGDGERRLGRYVLERRLGRGGQGEVWLAHDPDLQRRAAIKVQSALFVTEEQRRRFRREAESVARLEHPGVAQVFEADLESSPAYIAMRYVEGCDLGASLAAAREADGAGPWIPRRRRELVRVLRFFERCARALHAAHEAGVVHRDVKPGNVMVTPDGDPVLLDFGLAREADVDGEPAITRDGDVFGTLAYMAPEQLRGDLGAVSARTDVYGLGVTLFEALTGERPFCGASPAELAIAVDRGERPDPRDRNPAIGQDTAVVLATALERAPERRYPTALEFAEDLRRIIEYEPIRARPAGPLLRLQRWCRREPAWAATLVVTLVALVAGLALSQGALRRMRTLLGEKVAQQALVRVPELTEKAPAGAVAFVLSALELEDSWEARSALLQPLFELTLERRFPLEDAGRPVDVAFAGASRAIVVAGPGGGVRLFRRDGAGADAMIDVGAEARVVGVDADAPDAAVAVGTGDGRVLLLESADLARRREVQVGDGPVLDVRTQRGLVVATLSGALVLIDAGEGRVTGRFEGDHGGFGEAWITFASDGEPRVVARAARGLAVLAGEGLAPVLLDMDPARETRDLAVAARAPRAALVDASGRVDLYDLEGARRLRFDRGESLAPGLAGASVALSPAGDRLALGLDRLGPGGRADGERSAHGARWGPRVAGEGESCLRLLELGAARPAAGQDIALVGLRALGAGPRVVDVAFSPDGERLAAAEWSERVAVWDARTGALVGEHRDWNRPDVVRWAPGGGALASIGIGKSVEVWRDRPLAGAFRFEPIALGSSGPDADVVFCAFVPGSGGQRVVLCDAAGRAALFVAPPRGGAAGGGAGRPGRRRARIDPASPHAPARPASPGGARVAVAAAAPRVAWLGAGGRLRVLDGDGGVRADRALGGFTGSPRALALSPDGARFAAVDGAGRVFGGALAAACAPLAGVDGALVAFAANGDGLFVALTSGRVLRVPVDASGVLGDPAPLTTPEGWRESEPHDLVVAPDGREVVAIWRGASAPLGWHPGTGELVREGGDRRLRRFLFAGRGGLLASAARGPGTIEVVRGDRPLPRLDLVVEGELEAIAASRDARLGAVAASDGRVVVWDLATGTPLLAPRVHGDGGGSARCVAFDGAGAEVRILSAGAGGAALWPVDVVSLARAVSPRGTNLYERRLLSDAEAFFSR